MSDFKITYDGADLSPCCERGMTDYVFDISPHDYLGPATPETRAEVKAARRAEQRKSMKEMAIAYGVFFLLAAFFAVGTIVGNVNDADVRDIHIPVPSPSGERAYPCAEDDRACNEWIDVQEGR